jgi:hypothetical protein
MTMNMMKMTTLVKRSSRQRTNTYSVWAEGYAATGERGGAQLLGRADGATFREACVNLFKSKHELQGGAYFDAANLTYWGCQLYDNETSARKAFG